MTPNRYKVPVRKWRRWSMAARFVFNELYSAMKDDPKAFVHPKLQPPLSRYWKTTAWNAAWVAADVVEEP